MLLEDLKEDRKEEEENDRHELNNLEAELVFERDCFARDRMRRVRIAKDVDHIHRTV